MGRKETGALSGILVYVYVVSRSGEMEFFPGEAFEGIPVAGEVFDGLVHAVDVFLEGLDLAVLTAVLHPGLAPAEEIVMAQQTDPDDESHRRQDHKAPETSMFSVPVFLKLAHLYTLSAKLIKFGEL